jgi:mannose-6-phosphate isomerase-like protein (cupin superfamily)
MDYSTIKANWQKRGFSCGIWLDPPGQVWADYVHDTDELIMLAEGEMELSFQGKTIRPRIGEEILIPALASHTVINTGKAANRWYYGYRQKIA